MATNTINYNLVKPALNETADIQVINDNMDKIDTEIKKVNTSLGDIASGLIAKYKKIKSGTPVDGIYPVVTWQRADGTKYKVSTLSGGTAPQWTTRTIQYYKTNGTTIEKTDTFTITYDTDGNVLSEV